MKVDLCDCIVYALYMVDSYLSSQGDCGDLYVYCVWFKVNVMFIYIECRKICSMISCSTPCKHCHIGTESKIGLVVNNIYGTRGAVTKQSSQHYVDPVILDAVCCAQSRAHEPLINLNIIPFFYILIAAGSWN